MSVIMIYKFRKIPLILINDSNHSSKQILEMRMLSIFFFFIVIGLGCKVIFAYATIY